MALEPGYVVSKHVRLVRKLKGGGMGSVWIADHLALHTQVAVKFISGDHVANPELSARFKREATSAARIKSPHVVQVHDHGVTEEGLPFIVMELLEGEDLSTRLKSGGPMSVDDVATIVEQTCRVLSRTHKLGVVHRDIKPANLFLVEADGAVFVKLLDFGVAKMDVDQEKSDLTNTGVMVGTLCYMSPEQLLDARNVDHRADLWSLAVVAYRALTGQLPFKDDNGLGALVLAVDRGIFPQASALVPGLPESIEPWFAKAFRRHCDGRFGSAKEMANELALALGRKIAIEAALDRDRNTVPDRPDPPTPISRTKIGLSPPASSAPTKLDPATPLSASLARAQGTEDPGTVSAFSRPQVKRRSSFLAWALISVMVLVVVGIAGGVAIKRFGLGVTASSASGTSVPATTEAAAPAPSEQARASDVVASSTAGREITPSSAAEPVSSLATAASSASARASAPVGPSRRVPPPGVPRKTEKDYGF